MVSKTYKSHSLRRVFVKTPGGRVVKHFRVRKTTAPRCAVTGIKLHGIKSGKPVQLRTRSKSEKRPSRAYGGVLSSSAARRAIIAKARTVQ
jgi:large subunit ribosomal protein L34e